MKPIKPCNTYHALSAGRESLRLADGKSAFKVYFVDIIGRPEPAQTVWAASGIDRGAFLVLLAQGEQVEGIGFVIAFPHITKVFRFGPEAETVIHVRAFDTRSMAPLDLGRSDGYVEFACLAEALIAADEYRFWAEVVSVEAYLERWSDFADGPLAHNDKLRRYWE